MKSINFERKVRLEREKNQYILKQSLNKGIIDWDLREKIQKYAQRYGLVENYVYDKLLFENEDMFFNGFEKDPWRQNIYEILQLNSIQTIEIETNLIRWVQKLSSSGTAAKYIKNGEILNLDKKERGDLKSLDFYWYYEFWGNKLEFFVTAKYTQDEWWAQDNQANDVFSTFQEAKQIKNDNIFFVALVDWDYYYREKEKWGNENFFTYLNAQDHYWRCVCVDTERIFDVIKFEVLKWLSIQSWDSIEIAQEMERIEKIVNCNN